MRNYTLLYQLSGAISFRFRVFQYGFRLSHGAGLFGRHPIVGAIGRQTETRARLGQSGFRLLHAQLVILLFYLGDRLSLVDHTAEID